jgi:hypothetical protein
MKEGNEMSDRFTPVRSNVARRIKGRDYLHEYSCLDCGHLYLASRNTMRRSFSTGKCRSCSQKTHGMTHDPRFKVWTTMRDRCENPAATSFNNYGGRGVSVCKEWKAFEGFMKWEKFNEYLPGLQLDRIDNDGDYEPRNCRWVTCRENTQNTRRNKLDAEKVRDIRLLYDSGEFTQQQIANRFGVNRMTVLSVVRGKTWGNIQ